MEDRSLETTKDTSPAHTHHPSLDLTTHTPTDVSPRSQTPGTVSPKTSVQISDHLKHNGERKTSLTPVHTTTSYLSEEGQECDPGEPQIGILRTNSVNNGRRRSDAADIGLSGLFGSNLSKSVEDIVSAPRKEISASLLVGTGRKNLTFHNDVSFRYFAIRMTHSKLFNRMMLFLILVNVLCIAFQNETTETHHLQKMFRMFSDVFTAIYTFEFAVKLYSDRSRYWVSVYNLFDFSILLVAYVDMLMVLTSAHSNKLASAMRSLRAFRALKIVNFLPGVQVIATALVRTLRELIVDVILLLVLLLFAFGVMGYYFFGYDAINEKVLETWGTLSSVFLSLFTLVTADSWWKFIEELVNEGGHSVAFSRAYIVTFLFFGHFITANLFIAVIITNIQSSSNDFKTKLLREREILVQDRKREYWSRSRREVKRMMSNKNLDGESNFNQIATDFYYSLQRRDFVVKSDLKSNILWVDTVCREVSRAIKSNRKVIFLQRGMVSSIGPVCNLSEVDRRKISISTESRFVVKHKMTGLQYLTTPNSSGKGRKNSTLHMPEHSLNAPRLSIFRRKSKLGN